MHKKNLIILRKIPLFLMYLTTTACSISLYGSDSRGVKTIHLNRNENPQGTTVINNPTTPWIITKPGSYKLISNIECDPSFSTTLIAIQSNNVKINLNGCSLSQILGSTKNLTGIHIADNLSNIAIENGNINNVTGTGIIVGQNCFNIGIQNMIIVQTGSGGVFLDSNTDTVCIHNCFIGKSLTTGKNNNGISLNTNKNITLCQSTVTGVQAPYGYNAYSLYADSCNYCSVSNCNFNVAKGDTAIGILLNNCNDFRCKNNETNGNSASNGSSYGIKLINSRSNVFESIQACQNQGLTNAYGIYIEGTSRYNQFKTAITNHQQTTGTGSAYGIYVTEATGNLFSCITSLGNIGGTGSNSEGAGIYFTNTTGNTVEKSYCSYNKGNAGTGYGIRLANNSCCVIDGNKLYYNHGTTAGYGIQETGTPSSFVANNKAFGNGINYELTFLTRNSIQTISYDSPRSVSTSTMGNISITS